MTFRAIIAPSNKDGADVLARSLTDLDWEVYATGGTHRFLAGAGIDARHIEDLTGFPEILGGRVKTLHPRVHGGILAKREEPEHVAQMEEHGIGTIDLIAVNLYPFAETVSKPDVTLMDALEQIDIGGPTMVRAAAKNFPAVIVLIDPADYAPVLEMLRAGVVPVAERRRLARKAFEHVSAYDTIIANYLSRDMGAAGMDDEAAALPAERVLPLQSVQSLRYGENPHQAGALYTINQPGRPAQGIPSARQVHGREMSFNNILDADAAWNVVSDFQDAPTVAIIKHGNPCGLATAPDLATAFSRALAGDPVSAFGGIIAANRPMDKATAEAINEAFYEIVIAPSYDDDALSVLTQKRNLRLLEMGDASAATPSLDIRTVRGGFLVQAADMGEMGDWQTVTERTPTDAEIADLRFAWKAARHVKSNAIVIVKDGALLGMGAGQPNRLISVELALKLAGDEAQGAVVASDAFFPFADGLEMALKGGVTAAVEPGGSVRDDDVIAAANSAGAAMVFTGIRHFRH
ncbi:MAG: bifunctional phosphoribosylaminoimidazolecarboxamide formyltransferase/IMP cyclohydrolase [Chloroflexi bacterium]|nr:bifunctional phosphoribosylaminoimidazolecarboxamide formyltransferase/IMP cyclohydrolase [Chloroflexota bacterium]